MKRQFRLRRSQNNNKLFKIGFVGETYEISPTGLKILPARLLKLSYPDYLQTCVDDFNAKIEIEDGIPIPIFSKTDLVKLFLQILNARLEYIIWEKKHPYDIIENENGELELVPFVKE